MSPSRWQAMVPLRKVAVIAVVAGLAAVAGAPARAADPSKADIQWAQTVLKEQGFDAGAARGEMNDRTRAALGAFQKKHGLPASGRLDAATTAKLLAIRESAPTPTMGNLAAPRPAAGASGQGTVAPAAPPRVQAAPTIAVQAAGEADEAVVESVGAAPRTAVTTDDGRPAGGASPAAGPEGWGIGGLAVPGWAHSALYAGMAALVLLAGLAWWRAGRPKARRPVHRDDAGRDRVAPTLGPSRRGPDLRAERL